MTPLADVLRTGSADAQLREILDHIWSNRRLTAPMLTGSRALVTRSLVRLFEERLEERRTRASPTARRVAAAVLAGALLAFFDAWFSDEAPAKPDVVAPRWPV